MQSFSYFQDTQFDDNLARSGFAVIGAETRASELDALGDVATYDGFSLFYIRQDGLDDADYKYNARADVSLTADFGSDTIGGEGTFDKLLINGAPVDFDAASGYVFLNTTIQGNAFSGNIGANDALLADTTLEDGGVLSSIIEASEYSGVFFGPNGEQIGGVASGSATVGENGYIMYGIFDAD